jgi:phenylacetate-coenzyme A ligase PaaK-like adenylate-forming protein
VSRFLRFLGAVVPVVAEPLLPETRHALAEAFGAPVVNGYGASAAAGSPSAAGSAPGCTCPTIW